MTRGIGFFVAVDHSYFPQKCMSYTIEYIHLMISEAKIRMSVLDAEMQDA